MDFVWSLDAENKNYIRIVFLPRVGVCLQKGDTFLQRFLVIIQIVFEFLRCDHFFVHVRTLTTDAAERSSNDDLFGRKRDERGARSECEYFERKVQSFLGSMTTPFKCLWSVCIGNRDVSKMHLCAAVSRFLLLPFSCLSLNLSINLAADEEKMKFTHTHFFDWSPGTFDGDGSLFLSHVLTTGTRPLQFPKLGAGHLFCEQFHYKIDLKLI